MRTKFKVWDKRQKKWVSEDVVIDCNGVISISNLDSDIQQVEDLEIVWYTGEKDKNGVEGYNGDIIETIYPDRKLPNRKIYFKDGIFGVDNVCNKFIPLSQLKNYKIIGNIYENRDKVKYTENDVKELDRIISRCESQNQMERIEGRMEYKKFASRFTESELKEMAKKIGCSV